MCVSFVRHTHTYIKLYIDFILSKQILHVLINLYPIFIQSFTDVDTEMLKMKKNVTFHNEKLNSNLLSSGAPQFENTRGG